MDIVTTTNVNIINKNLSVINAPDSIGVACEFQVYRFYLGGKRSYAGLPNYPDFDLGSLVGSICDSLSKSISNIAQQNPRL